jgi:hypothetical protein
MSPLQDMFMYLPKSFWRFELQDWKTCDTYEPRWHTIAITATASHGSTRQNVGFEWLVANIHRNHIFEISVVVQSRSNRSIKNVWL